MDIGMEQSDAALGGQDDMFELDDAASRALRGKRAGAGYDSDSDSDAADHGADADEEEVLDSEEERERKLAHLEDELDGMYDAYQEHLKERDAKYKVKEARKNNKAREEWGGIDKSRGRDEDSSDDEGGWDQVDKAKARIGEDDSSDDDSSDEGSSEIADARLAGKKRRRQDERVEGSSKSKKARTAATLEPPQVSSGPLSRSAQMWFDQDIFAGADDEIEEDDGDEEFEDEDEESGEGSEEDEAMEESGDEVSTTSRLLRLALMLSQSIARPPQARTTTTTLRSSRKTLTTTLRCGMLMEKMKTRLSRPRSKVSHFSTPTPHHNLPGPKCTLFTRSPRPFQSMGWSPPRR